MATTRSSREGRSGAERALGLSDHRNEGGKGRTPWKGPSRRVARWNPLLQEENSLRPDRLRPRPALAKSGGDGATETIATEGREGACGEKFQ